jgi:hypothetical protein
MTHNMKLPISQFSFINSWLTTINMASSSRPQRSNTQRDYLALNLGYEDDAPVEGRYPDLLTVETSFSDICYTILISDPDPILPSESSSQTLNPDPELSFRQGYPSFFFGYLAM